MKAIIIAGLISLLGFSAVAETITVKSLREKEAVIDVYRVADSIVLGQNGGEDITVRLVTEYLGKSTDVSAQKNLYITYFHGGEMNNVKTSFALGGVFKLKGAKRLSAGIYEIEVVDLDLRERKFTVDATQVFIDDRNLKLDQFEHPYLHSTITVTNL